MSRLGRLWATTPVSDEVAMLPFRSIGSFALRRPVPFVVLLLALVALTACTRREEQVFRRTPQELIGEAFPELSIRSVEEGNGVLSHPEGPAIVSVWATWCVPCREEVPVLRSWSQAHPDVSLVFINADEDGVNDAQVAETAAELGVAEPVERLRGRMMGTLGVRALPTLFLIDDEGQVVLVEEGYIGAAGLRNLLDEWVAEGYQAAE